jgi:hypothetical protein
VDRLPLLLFVVGEQLALVLVRFGQDPIGLFGQPAALLAEFLGGHRRQSPLLAG